jgi:hypothetical protein
MELANCDWDLLLYKIISLKAVKKLKICVYLLQKKNFIIAMNQMFKLKVLLRELSAPNYDFLLFNIPP